MLIFRNLRKDIKFIIFTSYYFIHEEKMKYFGVTFLVSCLLVIPILSAIAQTSDKEIIKKIDKNS